MYNVSLPIYERHMSSTYFGLLFLSKMLCSFRIQISHIFTIFILMYLMFLGVITNDITKISLSLSCRSIEIELIFYTDLQFRDHIKYVYYI